MTTSLSLHEATQALIPPDPAEVAASKTTWRRVGWLQRLVKLEDEPDVTATAVPSSERTGRAEQRAA